VYPLLKQPGNRKALLLLDLTVGKQRMQGVSFGTGQGLELCPVNVVESNDGYVLHHRGSVGSQCNRKQEQLWPDSRGSGHQPSADRHQGGHFQLLGNGGQDRPSGAGLNGGSGDGFFRLRAVGRRANRAGEGGRTRRRVLAPSPQSGASPRDFE
jgi:hypothetical protein